MDKLTQAHQAKLDAIKAQSSDINEVNELKAQLQKKLDTLKVNHEAKLAQIQKDADAKIAKIKADAQNDPEIVKLQARIATIKSNLAAQKKSLDDQYAALVASDQAAYQKLENQLKSSASEGVAKGKNDSYTTSDGKTVVLPHESATADGKTVVLPHESATTDSKTAVLAHDSTVTDEKPVALPHEAGEAQTTVSVNYNTVVRPEVATITPIATVNATAPTVREEVKAPYEGKLPQTGNDKQAGLLSLIGTSLMASLEVFGLSKKEKHEN